MRAIIVEYRKSTTGTTKQPMCHPLLAMNAAVWMGAPKSFDYETGKTLMICNEQGQLDTATGTQWEEARTFSKCVSLRTCLSPGRLCRKTVGRDEGQRRNEKPSRPTLRGAAKKSRDRWLKRPCPATLYVMLRSAVNLGAMDRIWWSTPAS